MQDIKERVETFIRSGYPKSSDTVRETATLFLIKELTEREAKLVSLIKELRLILLENDIDLYNAVEETFESLGLQE